MYPEPMTPQMILALDRLSDLSRAVEDLHRVMVQARCERGRTRAVYVDMVRAMCEADLLIYDLADQPEEDNKEQ